MFQIGGGISGDFPICVVPMLHQDLLRTSVPLWGYFCQISDSTTSYGSYSGAVPNEKITWGKLGVKTPKFIIESDATIVAPLIFAHVLGLVNHMKPNDFSDARVLVTGGAGFIGSALVWALNRRGCENIVVCDLLGTNEKWRNLTPLRFADYVEAADLLPRLQSGALGKFDLVLHLGACSATTEKDATYLIKNNYEFTKDLAAWSLANKVALCLCVVRRDLRRRFGGHGRRRHRSSTRCVR